jgi:GTP-binding protein Era
MLESRAFSEEQRGSEVNQQESPSNRDLSEYEVPEGHKSGFVAVVGRPNVGKSTLINAFLQQKIAIVTPRPQTTRRRQLGILTLPDCQIVFIDTPGMMEPRHKLDEFMLATALESIEESDGVLWLVDAAASPGPADKRLARNMAALADDIPVILAMNKGDLLKPAELVSRTEAYRSLLPDAEWILFSALKGNGRDALLQMVVDALPEGPRLYPADQLTDSYIRDIAAELIREQIMLQLREEIPYGTAVVINEFKERANGTIYVDATIVVERNSHKQIIIGSKGAQLRRLGTAARKEIEAMVETKLFLELWVKVVPKWRKKSKALRRLGYAIP